MTLVLNLISPTCVIQVSDRRFVWPDSKGGVARKDDYKNKSVVWCHRVAFAFTGIANLGMERRTDLWLMKEISAWETSTPPDQADQGALAAAIAKRATDYFNGPRISRLPPEVRRHAFAGVGWARFPDGRDIEPYVIGIYNFAGAGPVRHKFEFGIQRLTADQRIYVWWTGQDLGAEAESGLDALSSLDPATDDFADRASYVLGEAVRRTATDNELVGRGLLITVLPRDSITPGEVGGAMLAGGSMKGQQTFLYVPPDADEAIVYGPSYTCQGMQMTNFKAGPPSEMGFPGVDPPSPPAS